MPLYVGKNAWLVLVFLVLLVCYIGSAWRGTHSRSSGILVEPSALDLGEVFPHPSFAWRVPLTNTSTNTVCIEKFTPSCNCTASIQSETLTLGPGETKSVGVTLNLFRAPDGSNIDSPTEFSATILADTDVFDAPPVQFTIKATVVPHPLRVNPPIIDCGSLIAGEEWPTFLAEVDASGSGLTLQECVSNTKLEDPSYSVSSDNLRAVLEFKLSGSLNPGPIVEYAEIRLNLADRQRWRRMNNAVIPIEIKGEILPTVQAYPDTIVPGVLSVDDEYCDTISLSAHGRAFSAIQVAPKTASSATVRQLNLDESRKKSEWQVLVRCNRPGPCEEFITFHARLDKSPTEYKVVVPIRYRGIVANP